MDRVNNRMKIARFQDENSKISNLMDPDAEKTNLWTKVTKLAKPRGRKWHFTRKLICRIKERLVP
ncbi:hypothetical protein Hanom_Chr17g01542531 [Helianthus anomalus]